MASRGLSWQGGGQMSWTLERAFRALGCGAGHACRTSETAKELNTRWSRGAP